MQGCWALVRTQVVSNTNTTHLWQLGPRVSTVTQVKSGPPIHLYLVNNWNSGNVR